MEVFISHHYNLSTPLDPPPDTEVDDDPHQQQTHRQVRYKSAAIFYGIGYLDHVVSCNETF